MSEYERSRELGPEDWRSVDFAIWEAWMVVCLRRKSRKHAVAILREVSELLSTQAEVVSISRPRSAMHLSELAAERWKATLPALVAALGREEGT